MSRALQGRSVGTTRPHLPILGTGLQQGFKEKDQGTSYREERQEHDRPRDITPLDHDSWAREQRLNVRVHDLGEHHRKDRDQEQPKRGAAANQLGKGAPHGLGRNALQGETRRVHREGYAVEEGGREPKQPEPRAEITVPDGMRKQAERERGLQERSPLASGRARQASASGRP